ncbi:helix-turn-helix transcriptional regulator [Thermomonas aquatica]|uniref:AlpA family transcriptional regulator n=1 Tax=Thermomonas aquatica TaxID=2202149 RepID=A0A5B7ZV31_9GAMM|nr:AlpA family transcriptional regulator [Thermomonas aquatica]QDA57672.1 AlpA family transcriptional regulator [Thermomonas aquatica]
MVIKNQQVPTHTVVLRRRTVEARTGLSRSTIYLRMAQGTFPKSIPLGPRAIGWLEAEVEAWLQAQVASVRNDE